MLSALLRRLVDAVSSVEERVAARAQADTTDALRPAVLKQAAHALEPDAARKARVWSRIESRLEPERAANLLTQVRQWLEPSAEQQARVRALMSGQLAPTPARAFGLGFTKWSVAVLIVAVLVRSSPLLFLAPRTVAATSVTLAATRGTVSLGDEGLLQPVTGEITLEGPGRVTTGEGEATFALHSYGVVRLAPATIFTLDDLGTHPELPVTGSLDAGTAWIYGLIPSGMSGLSVETPAGIVTVNEGSVGLTVRGSLLTVDVWDRTARIAVDNEEFTLQPDQRLVAGPGIAPRLSAIDAAGADAWVTENLARDAAHRRELAQWQHEVRAANAGILPTSPLYPVKRAAEAVDLLFTFGGEARAQKTLALAETRLNEAAALLPDAPADAVEATSQVLRLAASGSAVIAGLPDASGSGALVRSLLDEYRDTILSLAHETEAGSGATADFVADEIAANAVQLAAAMPTDVSYPLKQAVLATAAALPESDAGEGRQTVLLDAIASLRTTLQAEPETDLSGLADLSPLLSELRTNVSDNSAEVQREATALERTINTLARQRRPEVALETESRRGPVLPLPAQRLTVEQIEKLVGEILGRINVYRLPASRFNQLVADLKAVEGLPDEGQILRRLDAAIANEPGLSARLRARMRELKESRALEIQTGSGETAPSPVDAA